MKKIILVSVLFISFIALAVEINYISFTNTAGQVTKVAIFGKLNSVKVSCGTNNIPYIVTTTNTIRKISN